MPRTAKVSTNPTVRLPINIQTRVIKLLLDEAMLAGMDRNEFMRMLIRRGMGALRAERAANAPERKPFRATEKKPEIDRVDIWVHPEHRKWLEGVRDTSGGTPISVILSLLVLDWVGINPLREIGEPSLP